MNLNSFTALVASDRLKEALDLLGDSDEIVILKSRLNRWYKDDRMGLSPSPVELNKIRQSILHFGNKMSNPTTNPSSQNVDDVCKYIATETDLQKLVAFLLEIFKNNRDYLIRFLPLKQEYENATLLDGGLSLDQTKVWKQNLVNLYKEFTTGQVSKKYKENKQDLDDVHAILSRANISKQELSKAIDFVLLFMRNNGTQFHGTSTIENLKKELNSQENNLLESVRPDRFQRYISEKHLWLKEVVSRLITSVAKDNLNL